jgi:ABC-type dipeptide/oligopeptide/nickel transport system permease component
MSLASIELPIGCISFMFGVVFGAYQWIYSMKYDDSSSAGTVMLAALPVILGLQLILAFLAYDIRFVPTRPIHRISRYVKKPQWDIARENDCVIEHVLGENKC